MSSSALDGLNLFSDDENLDVFLRRMAKPLAEEDKARLKNIGHFAATRLEAQAEMSDRHYPPQLRDMPDSDASIDRRVNRLTINPEYEDCQQEIYRNGVLARCFDEKNPAPHTLPFITQYLLSKSDISTGCPFAMTHPAAVILDQFADKAIKNRYLPEILRTDGKAVICGTWATEKHSGSDVGGSVTKAIPDADQPKGVKLHGHQFFTSAYGFKRFIGLKTARPEGGKDGVKGLGLYLVPSHIDEDWEVPNNIEPTSLKRKMGTKGLPTAEVELKGAQAYEIVPEGKGINAMMAALGCSRVHNAMAAAGTMHRSYLEALHWAKNRVTFGKPLIERPMIQKRILDIATQWKAGTALAFEAARSYDDAQTDPKHASWMRLTTALAKFKTAEQSVWCAQKALELVGGNGYTEDYAVSRLFRDAMVLPVWEGPEQIQALELVRILAKEPEVARQFIGRMGAIATALPSEMQEEQNTLKALAGDLTKTLDSLGKSPENAEVFADDLLHSMSNMLSYALMCEEAAWELAHDNNASKLLFTRQFHRSLTMSALGAPDLESASLLSHFNDVVNGKVISHHDLSNADPHAEQDGLTPP